MASHAIVIGIDRYDPAIGPLDGAVADALAFAAWVTGAGGVPAENLRLLLEPDPSAPPPVLPEGVTGFSPVSSRGIRVAIDTLRAGGERLYFYYAGHGASILGWPNHPVLIPPEFRNPRYDISFLFGFNDLFQHLGEMPFAEQICLIDACRDFGLEGYEPVIPSGVRRQLTERKGRQYVLYSVAPGQRAAETGQGIWTRTLLDGLTTEYRTVTRGTGTDRRYEVRLDTLAEWVRDEVARRIERKFLRDAARYVQTPLYDRDPQGGSPLMTTFTRDTVPRAKLRVFVEPALAHPTCKVSVMQYVDGLGEEIPVDSCPPPLLRVPVPFELRPSDYSIRAEAESFVTGSRGWTVLDDPLVRLTLQADLAVALHGDGESHGEPTRGGVLWDRPASFEIPVRRGVGPTLSQGSGALIVPSPDADVLIEVLNARREVVHRGLGSFRRTDLPPGIYRIRSGRPGAEPSEETVEVRSGARVEYRRKADAEIRLASLLLLAAFAAQHPERSSQARFSVFGVRQLPQLAPGGSGVLVLVGAGGDQTPEELARFLAECRVSLLGPDGTLVAESGLDPLPDLPSAAQREILLDGYGSWTAELRLPGLAAVRHATGTRPDQITVLVAVAEADGTMDVRQTLLPTPSRSRSEGFDAGLRRMRSWDLAQAIYAAGDPALASDVISRDPEDPHVDPLRACLACYSLALAQNAGILAPLVRRLLEVAPDCPDVQVLAGLFGAPEERDRHFAKALELGLPVFSEGLRLLAERFLARPPHLAEALASLIPGSPWTAWLALPASEAIASGAFNR